MYSEAMGGRRRATSHCEDTLLQSNLLSLRDPNQFTASHSKTRKPQTCRLLSLPAEIRTMIWKAVVGPDPILLYGKSYTVGGAMEVETLTSISLSSTYANYGCDDLHLPELPKPPPRPRRKTCQALGPLSWLRTNQQIYTEAKPIIHSNANLQICDPFVFVAFLRKTPKSVIQPETLRSLSLCLKIKIETNLRDGFSFAQEVSHGGHRWGAEHMNEYESCCCPWCFALHTLRPELTDKLLSLRELRLRICFSCTFDQGNMRPITHSPDGRLEIGQLYRPKSPIPLVWVDQHKRIEELAENLCNEKPLKIFCEAGRALESVDVQFCTENIQHDVENRCPQPHDTCWCRGRSINEQTLPLDDIAKALERRLKAYGSMDWLFCLFHRLVLASAPRVCDAQLVSSRTCRARITLPLLLIYLQVSILALDYPFPTLYPLLFSSCSLLVVFTTHYLLVSH